MQHYSYEQYQKTVDYIFGQIDFQPEIAIVLGSALGSLSEEIEEQTVIDYMEIPNFLQSTVESHAGKLILGKLQGKNVVCMSGRFHYYEGYEFEQLVLPIRAFKLLGAHTVILTNAAGAVNTAYNPGDIMLISDHIKLMGASPLRGINLEQFGPRFFDVSDMYSKELRALAKHCAKAVGHEIHEGVYMFMPGPQFETPAEIRAIRALGADAVGMSTVTEALTAAHLGMRVLGMSLITNMAAGVLENRPVSSDEVDETGESAALYFKAILREIVRAC